MTVILPSAATLALLLFLRTGWPEGRGTATFERLWIPLFVLSRVIYAVVLYVLLDYETASDSWYWKVYSLKVLHGEFPGRDFPDGYAPLFLYLQAGSRFLLPGWHWVGTLFPFMVGDFLALLYGGRIGRALLGDRGGTWVRAWLLVTPLLWHQLVVRGQDESLFLGTLLLALAAALGRRPVATGLALSFGLLATKVTYAPYALGLLLVLREGRWRAFAAFAIPSAVVYGIHVAIGGSIFPTGAIGEFERNFGLGVSLPDTLGRVLPSLPNAPLLGFYALAMVAAAVAVPLSLLRGSLLDRGIITLAVVHATTMLTMPFCVSPYIAQGVAFPLLLFAVWPRGSAVKGVGLTTLVLLGLFAALSWTLSRVFTIPLKPLSISFHLLCLWVAFRVIREEMR